MRLPSQAPLLLQQRFLGRFWSTQEMMDALSMYYGLTAEQYNRTRSYRIIIAVHRDQYSDRYDRKGYGPDWKEAIKDELKEYTAKGKLPLIALRRAGDLLRQVELMTWTLARAQAYYTDRRHPALVAAE